MPGLPPPRRGAPLRPALDPRGSGRRRVRLGAPPARGALLPVSSEGEPRGRTEPGAGPSGAGACRCAGVGTRLAWGRWLDGSDWDMLLARWPRLGRRDEAILSSRYHPSWPSPDANAAPASRWRPSWPLAAETGPCGPGGGQPPGPPPTPTRASGGSPAAVAESDGARR